jgi:hypothetical protein
LSDDHDGRGDVQTTCEVVGRECGIRSQQSAMRKAYGVWV